MSAQANAAPFHLTLKRFFREELASVRPPIFPGPIPGRGAPELQRPVRAQLEPIRPVPVAPRRGQSFGWVRPEERVPRPLPYDHPGEVGASPASAGLTGARIQRLVIEEPEELSGRAVLYAVEPFGRRDLSFSVATPREYDPALRIARRERLTPGEFQRLCVFESVVEPNEGLEIAVARPGEVSLIDLGVADIKRHKLSPYSIGELEVGDRSVVEHEARVRRADGEVLAIRTLYYPNGERVFRISLTLEAHNVRTRDQDWDGIVQTFRSLAPEADPLREPFERYRAKGRTLLSFNHPSRFVRTELEREGQDKAAQITLVAQGAEVARVRAEVVPIPEGNEGPSLEALCAGVTQDAGSLGLGLIDDQPIASETAVAPPPVFTGRAVFAAYAGQTEAGEAREVRVVALRSRRAAYRITSVTPTEEASERGFMLGKRAFELVCRTLCRPDAIRPYDLLLEAPPEAEGEDGTKGPVVDLVQLLAETQEARRDQIQAAATPVPTERQEHTELIPGSISRDLLEEENVREVAQKKPKKGRHQERAQELLERGFQPPTEETQES